MSYNPYTPDEVRQLREFYKVYDEYRDAEFNMKNFAASIGRSRVSVMKNAKKLGLHGKPHSRKGVILRSSRYIVNAKTKCWETTLNLNPSGKGYLQICEAFDGAFKSSRRAIYEQNVGKIPQGMVLRAKCKNDRCINPKHMLILSRGESNSLNSSARLTQDQVNRVFELWKRGWKQKRIAHKYGVSPSLICKIIKGTRWVGRTPLSEGK